jgi:hypothetical protein
MYELKPLACERVRPSSSKFDASPGSLFAGW